MKSSFEDARKFVRNSFCVITGVLLLVTAAIFVVSGNFRDGFLFLLAVPFGLSAYGLSVKRSWAIHISLILEIAASLLIMLNAGVLETSLAPLCSLVLGTLPIAIVLEFLHQKNLAGDGSRLA